MTTPDFTHLSRLVDCPVREAWAHEAHHFTVWLSQNLDRLSDVLGITLELDAVEVPIGTFYADIIARNVDAEDGADRVLIENQLEPSDHRHLGQIMTYLAGAEVSTVVWVAETFREEHLSAIEWLNHNTSTGFSFFAIKLRAVRIGDSPIAPLLDVVAKPNDWERQVKAAATTARNGLSVEGQQNGAFWRGYLDAYPSDGALGVKQTNLRNNYMPVRPGILVSIWASYGNSGVFVRPASKDDVDRLGSALAPHLAALRIRLVYDSERSPSGYFLSKKRPIGNASEEDWPNLMEWLHSEAERYLATLTEILPEDGIAVDATETSERA